MSATLQNLPSKKGKDNCLLKSLPLTLKYTAIDRQDPKFNKNELNRFLVQDLEEDHDLLLCNYDKLMECAREGNFLLLSCLLKDFIVLVTNHLQKEDNELYAYLEEMGKEHSETEIQVLRKFRFEMIQISEAVFSTLERSPNIPVTSNTVEGFIADFNHLGEILIDRIRREESILFPMYKRSKKVA